MDTTLSVLLCIISLAGVYSAVPREVCQQQFRWEDCGQPPKAVIYYYKSGSRCEVGVWRGCLPNPNMFADEYECVHACIFSQSARAPDFHSHQGNALGSGETTPADSDVDESTTESTVGADATDIADVTGNQDEHAATEGAEDNPTEAAPEAETEPPVDGRRSQNITTNSLS